MNAPYDGDRGQGAGGAASPGGPPVPPDAGQDGSVPPDPYLQHAYDEDPYRAQDLTAQDPVDEALYDQTLPAVSVVRRVHRNPYL
ncbi:hypothetical protein JHN50_28005, partial [Streptomyces sp. MBT98]|uniref:hypothetical protein n=1 Tax=Streptomyces sp. MBT98 TaxID=2800412 RepID=UPI00190D9348